LEEAHQRFGVQYRAYVELGIDEELKQFYGKGNIMPYPGSDEFRSCSYEQRVNNG
jgi:hypothetical protein